MKVYFINNKEKSCGVYQYGLRLWGVLQNSNLEVSYFEVGTAEEFLQLDFSNVDLLFFNWIEGGSSGPFGWYTHSLANMINDQYKIPTITIRHTHSIFSTRFDCMVDQHPATGLTRPLYKFDDNKPKQTNDVIRIGSFGFAGTHKRFDHIVKLVNEQFDSAIINLNITNAFYGDVHGVEQQKIIDMVTAVPRKPNVVLNITRDFLDNEQLLDFVHNNDIIIFTYEGTTDVSSAPDYVISTNTPIAVTNAKTFDHIYKKEIDINLRSITEILDFNKESKYVESLRNRWSDETLLTRFEQVVRQCYGHAEGKTYSQVFQDRFVLKLIGNRGFFFDLGAGWDHGDINSNTLLLEECGWDGITVDGNMDHAQRRNDRSIRSVTISAFIPRCTIKEILDENNAPKVIDYVSIDIEPESIVGLRNFPFDEYQFKILTFEHDLYVNGSKQKDEAYELLTSKGYVRLCNNVNVPESMGLGLYFEDWWVNPTYFSEEFIHNNTFDGQLGSHIVTNIRK